MSLGPETLIDHDQILIQTRGTLMLEIVSGETEGCYSEWLLEGKLHEVFSPTLVLAVFPNLDGNPDLFAFSMTDDREPVIAYWRRAASLELPERVKEIEAVIYAEYGNIDVVGRMILGGLTQQVIAPKYPSAMIVFSRPEEGHPESAYLFAPTLVPPSITFEQITKSAKQYLRRLN